MKPNQERVDLMKRAKFLDELSRLVYEVACREKTIPIAIAEHCYLAGLKRGAEIAREQLSGFKHVPAIAVVMHNAIDKEAAELERGEK